MSEIDRTKRWYDASYTAEGFAGQRLFPNEELLRFMGRHFFALAPAARKQKRILEIGCGSCANLWMIAREGFDAYGIDLSPPAIELGRKMLDRWQTTATLDVASMTALPQNDATLDAVVDVFSSYCLRIADFETCLAETARVLVPGGLYFTYIPSTGSDAFRDHAPSEKLDELTLDGIRRASAPFSGNLYPFRFTPPDRLSQMMGAAGLRTIYLETVSRTYRRGAERFEFVVGVSQKEGP
jgi:ubiquinone/menaquinone biosynthesis C-methylase UbiE